MHHAVSPAWRRRSPPATVTLSKGGRCRKPGRRRRRSAFDSIFNDQFFRPDQVDVRLLKTESLDVQVRPLPSLHPTQNFSGLVGRYELSAKMEKTNLRVGDSATLTISLDGQGNIMDAQAPNVQPGAEFKAYADSPEEKITTTSSGTSGSKLFRTALVPITAGQFQLPPVQLTYFDIQSESYRTLSAEIPLLMVEATDPAQAAPAIIASQNIPDLKKRVQFTGRDILPPKETLDALRSHGQLDLKLFTLFLIVPMMAYGIIALARRWGQSDPTPAAKMKARAATALKSASHSTLEQTLTHLYQALTTAILSMAGREGEALTWQEARAMLENGGRSPESAQQIADLLAEIESMKYSGSPLSPHKKADLLARTRRMVKELTA